MTETTTGGHDQEPEARPETTAPEREAAPAATETSAPTPAAPAETTAAPAASAAAPAAEVPAAPAAEVPAAPAAETPAAPAAPASEAPAAPRPTGTVYTPGQAPQPYVAGQYRHEPAAAPAPGATAPTAPVAGAPAGAPHTTAPHPTAPQAAAPGGSGIVPPAFGGPAAASGAPAPAPAKPRRVGLGVAAAIVAAALIGGASGAGVTALVTSDDDTSTTQSATGAERIVVNDTESVNQVSAVAAAASPSVVTIEVAGGQNQGTGSGVILSEDGYVLTNTHVVTLDGATGDAKIQVKTDDGRLFDAELIGTDPLSDLAVIKLVDASDLTPIEFADSDELNVGDTAIAIGAPLGLSGTVTDGIISALNRSIDVESSAAPSTPDDGQGGGGTGQESPFDFWNYDGQQGAPSQQDGGLISIPVIQTDAAINPGNSGGALLDSQGKLIGVNVAILSTGGSSGQAGNIGVGFAVPANLAKRVSQEIIDNGAATHGLLGATVTSAQASGDSATVGALISEVSSGGAAEAAGLQSGDVVTALNGIPITDQTDLTAQVRALAGGSKAEITYTRDGESTTTTVTLGTFEG
ncbi:S1C family serine protease [Agromyces aurantiacus]|uniref:S1C family serine protease n=1 Tax=Agromyces aurantiacus TaxID=165814 RepID=UPI00195C61C5|nr:trypsin-like peptidase domain-containing protein [Agromyces aurantiacus]MBM7505275.1 putative serine protease PepD [Agromyces aurantiacus]